MKAARFSQFGSPEVLEIVDLPDPHAGPGQIRVVVHAAGVNPTDWKLRKGEMGGELPQTTGREVVAAVIAHARWSANLFWYLGVLCWAASPVRGGRR